MAVNSAISNNIDLFKKYIDDPSSLYGVFREASLTGDLETPFANFIGAKTLSYPVFPLDKGELEDYSATNGYTRDSSTYARREVTVTQDKGYQLAIDALDLIDSHTTAVMHANNKVRQKEVPAIDKYRLNKLYTSGTQLEVTAVTADNILDLYDKAIAKLVDNEYPTANTIMYVTTTTYNAIKNSSQVKRIIEVDKKVNDINRKVEMLDGTTKLVVIPATRWPNADCPFILVNPLAIICGVKRDVSRVIDNPENFDGVLVNRRIVHDLFIQEDRKLGVLVAKVTE